MRLRLLLPCLLVAALGAGAGATAHASGDRHQTFADGAASLRALWTRDIAEGVPPASLAPLRDELGARAPGAPWWSPEWLHNTGGPLLATLEARTRGAWDAALAGQRAQGQVLIAQWDAFATQQSSWITTAAGAAAARWPGELAAARTPAAVAALRQSWTAFLAAQQTATVAAQTARLDAELESAGGPQVVLATARRLAATANADNLDAGDVGALADRLAADIATRSADEFPAASELLGGIAALQGLIDLNDQINGELQPLLWSVDQAQAEATPHSGALAAADRSAVAQFDAARTSDQLTAAGQAVAAVRTAVAADLGSSQCGHAVPAGKAITISLSLQEMVFYQDGCAVRATPVSTGRPQLRTPTGTFSIFDKQSPFTFISPWPKSSPFYYYPSQVSWVMEFAGGGYFIHDAPWESPGAYGPGSEDNLAAASHGCVHTPTAVMAWAYSWTPLGTPVIITA